MYQVVIVGVLILILALLMLIKSKFIAIITLITEALLGVTALALIDYRPAFNFIQTLIAVAIVILIAWDLAQKPYDSDESMRKADMNTS